MAIKDARKVESKKRTRADASSSVAMSPAEMPPHVQPPPPQQPQPLPPGVYFSPTREECLGFLNRRIAGDTELRDARGHIHSANVYGESPDALRQRHPPASVRDRDPTWWFMSETKFQSQTVGGGASRRSDRQVEPGTYWRLEQSKEKLDDDGFKNTFGFYVGPHKRKDKTPWLMQEFTSTNDDGADKHGVPALYRVYVTPRATSHQLEQIFGEEGVKRDSDGNRKPGQAMIPAKYFDDIAALMPQGSVYGVAAQDQEHVQAPPPLPPVAPEGHPDDSYSQQEHYFDQSQQQHDQYEQQQQQYQYEQQQQHDQYEQQQYQYEQQQQERYQYECHDQYEQQQQQEQHGQYEQQQEQYLSHYYEQQQQQEQHLGQYCEQQQEPLSMIAPPIAPPASPGLLAELAPPENLSMPMADLMNMLDDNKQLTEPVKEEEPNWDSLDDIVDDSELGKFYKEG